MRSSTLVNFELKELGHQVGGGEGSFVVEAVEYALHASRTAAVGDKSFVEFAVVLAETEGVVFLPDGSAGCCPGAQGLVDDVAFEEDTNFGTHHVSFGEVESALSAKKSFESFVDEWEAKWAHHAGWDLFQVFGEGGETVV